MQAEEQQLLAIRGARWAVIETGIYAILYIDDDAGRGEDGFTLRIEDDGCGVEAGVAPRGTGLGSHISGAMAESLGASLVQANIGNGFRSVVERSGSGSERPGAIMQPSVATTRSKPGTEN